LGFSPIKAEGITLLKRLLDLEPPTEIKVQKKSKEMKKIISENSYEPLISKDRKITKEQAVDLPECQELKFKPNSLPQEEYIPLILQQDRKITKERAVYRQKLKLEQNLHPQEEYVPLMQRKRTQSAHIPSKSHPSILHLFEPEVETATVPDENISAKIKKFEPIGGNFLTVILLQLIS